MNFYFLVWLLNTLLERPPLRQTLQSCSACGRTALYPKDRNHTYVCRHCHFVFKGKEKR
ncbi:MAG: hypothetical protein HY774_01990 [Acidobacteria bacterium]|nr:hypothetical protein [Acidobacteriota bacterium]